MNDLITLPIFVIGLIVTLAITNDLETEQTQDQIYCQMVADKLWGAYNPDINCGENTNEP